MSKTSSPFNETHLKFNNVGGKIQESLKNIDEDIKLIETRELKMGNLTKFEKQALMVNFF